MRNSKRGISIITVLLFMLVATIAATATYKWITSQNLSSEARMLEREAWQASIAGLDAARAWMAYHANDVGALLSQKAGTENPIKLNSLIKNQGDSLLGSGRQNYDVYLVDFDTNAVQGDYRVRLLSVGTTRDSSAVHTEFAILRLGGLYRAGMPEARDTTDCGGTFDQAFYGSVSGMTNSPTLESAIINGDLSSSNQPSVTKELVVTGSATLQGSSAFAGANIYVGGNLTLNGTTTLGDLSSDTNVAYIGGNLTSCAGGVLSVGGDLYIGGDVDDCGCEIVVTGNFTMNGTLCRGSGNKAVTVTKNMVFTDEDSAGLNLDGFTGSYTVGDDLYLGQYLSPEGESMPGNIRKIGVGNEVYVHKNATYVFCYPGGDGNGLYSNSSNGNYPYAYAVSSQCDYDTYGTYSNYAYRYLNLPVDASGTYTWDSTTAPLSDIGDDYWEHWIEMMYYAAMAETGDEDSTVTQPVELAESESAIAAKVANSLCGLNTPIAQGDMQNADGTDSVFTKINECYAEYKDSADVLYNGFMVISFDACSASNMKQSVGVTMSGNFIFYYPNGLTCTMYFPPTTSSSVILIYLAGTNGGGVVNTAGGNSDSYSYNYYIYSEISFSMSSAKIQGSVIMANGSTISITSGNVSIEVNYDVINALFDADILTTTDEWDEFMQEYGDCEGSFSGVVYNGYDGHFISVAPQLVVKTESQYKNTEESYTSSVLSSAEEFDGGLLVLPRVVFLEKNPYGTLGDYYNVFSLPGMAIEESHSITCSGGDLPTSGLLYEDSTYLDPGLYECEVTVSGVGSDSLYVVVQDATISSSMKISFAESYYGIDAGSSATVQVVLPASSATNEITFTVQVGDLLDGWSFSSWMSGCSEDETYIYTCTLSTSGGTTYDLVKVSLETSATAGSMTLQLISPCTGCTIGSPQATTVYLYGTVTVDRAEFDRWCDTHSGSDECSNYDASAPDCEASDFTSTGIWVEASGQSCETVSANDQWTCGILNSISLVAGEESEYCTIYIADTTLSSLTDGETYTLYASAKRKAFALSVDVSGAANSSVSVIRTDETETWATDIESSWDTTAYAGYTFMFLHSDGSDDDFSYWKVVEGGDTLIYAIDTLEWLVDTALTVIAVYNDVDEHCFEEDFEDFSTLCSSTSDLDSCITTCSGGNSTSSGCLYSGGVYPGADWVLAYANDGSSGYTELLIDSTGSPYLYTDNVSHTTFLLSSKIAGYEGELYARFQTGVQESESEFLNTGFVLRSDEDAGNYISLNVYGNTSGYMEARACKGEGLNVSSTSGCVTATSGAEITQNSMLDMKAAIEGDEITLTLQVNSGTTYTVTLDISSLSVPANALYQYLGLKLADANFKLYEISWVSSTYSKYCWDVSKAYCDMGAYYLGRIVPIDSVVRPWYALSRRLAENISEECNEATWSFEYNGCDFNDDLATTSSSAEYCASSYCTKHPNALSCKVACNASGGTYYAECNSYSTGGSDGGYFALEGDSLEFTESGMHGYEDYRTVIANAYCEASNSSLSTSYSVDCGAFYVGDYSDCSESLTLYTGSTSASTVQFNTNANVRGASLKIQLTATDTVVAYLVDSTGNQSQRFVLTNGTNSVTVEKISNSTFFNPEYAAYISFESGSYTLTSVLSSCPGAFTLSSCSASYNGSAGTWSIVINTTGSTTGWSCVVESDVGSYSGTVDCGNDLTISASGVITGLTSDQEYTFTVTATGSGDYSTEQEVACSAELSPIEVESCEISVETVASGSAAPTLSYSIYCPSEIVDNGGTCSYTVSLLQDGTAVKSSSGSTSSTSTSESWTPGYTTTDDDASSTFTYKVSVEDVASCPSTPTFNVVILEEPTAECTFSKAERSGTYTITDEDEVGWSATIYIAADATGTSVTKVLTKSGTGSTSATEFDISKDNWYDGTNYVLLSLGDDSYTTCATFDYDPDTEVYSDVSVDECYVSNTSYSGSSLSAFSGGSSAYFYANDAESSGWSAYVSVDGTDGSSSTCWSTSSCTFSFTTPSDAGSYTAYLYDSDGLEICAASFTVLSDDEVITCEATPDEVSVGETVTISLTSYESSTNCYWQWMNCTVGSSSSTPISESLSGTCSGSYSYDFTPSTTGDGSCTWYLSNSYYCTVEFTVTE